MGAQWRPAAHLGVASMAAPMFLASAGTADPLAQIAYAAKSGFAGITDNFLMMRDARTQSAMGEALRDHGMEMGSFTLVPPGQPAFLWTMPNAEVEAKMAPALAAVRRVGGGIINTVIHDDHAERETQLRIAADNLRRAAALAADQKRLVGLEPASAMRLPGALVEKAAEAAALVATVGHPALRLILDSCHLFFAGEDMAAMILEHADMLGAIQLADMPNRVAPGAGTLDLDRVLAALRQIGWTGLLEAEFFIEPANLATEAAALAGLQQLLQRSTPGFSA